MTYQFDASGRLRPLTEAELAARDADPKSAVIVRIIGTLDSGGPFWLYLAVKPSKYKEFMQREGSIRYADYGTVLRYGFEKGVPAAVTEEMKQCHGCDDGFLAAVIGEAKAAQAKFLKQQEGQRLNDIVAMLKKNKPS